MHPHSVLLKIKVYHITIRFDKDILQLLKLDLVLEKADLAFQKFLLRGNVSKPADF